MRRGSPRPSTMMLAGLRSRWTSPLRWAAARPAQIPAANSAALAPGKRPMREQGGHVFAIHKLHRNVKLPIDFTDIVNAANIRMRDLARGAYLVEKPFARLDLVRGDCREELKGDGLTEHKVGRAIDLAHASAAQIHDAVALRENRPGEETFIGAGWNAWSVGLGLGLQTLGVALHGHPAGRQYSLSRTKSDCKRGLAQPGQRGTGRRPAEPAELFFKN